MKEETRTYTVYRYDDTLGNRKEELRENPIAGFVREKSQYDHLIDDGFFDVHYHNCNVYRIFWNKDLFASKASLKKIVAGELVVAVVYINDYKKPLVVKSEPINERKAGFVGYRHDGKAIIAGTAQLFESYIEFDSAAVYDPVKFGCLCGGSKRIPKGPQPGPLPPQNPQPGPKK